MVILHVYLWCRRFDKAEGWDWRPAGPEASNRPRCQMSWWSWISGAVQVERWAEKLRWGEWCDEIGQLERRWLAGEDTGDRADAGQVWGEKSSLGRSTGTQERNCKHTTKTQKRTKTGRTVTTTSTFRHFSKYVLFHWTLASSFSLKCCHNIFYSAHTTQSGHFLQSPKIIFNSFQKMFT